MGIMFEADTKLLFAKYCLDIWLHLLKQVSLEGQKSQFSQCTVQFIYATFNQYFFFVFVTNYPISRQSLMDITFCYPLIGQFDTIWQAQKTYFLTSALVFYIYTITFASGHVRQFMQIIGKYVKCYTVILMSPSNKTIETLLWLSPKMLYK